MSSPANGSGSITGRADAQKAGTATAADAVGAGSGTPVPGSAAPLTALTSLLGGTIEAGTSCAADGTCD